MLSPTSGRRCIVQDAISAIWRVDPGPPPPADRSRLLLALSGPSVGRSDIRDFVSRRAAPRADRTRWIYEGGEAERRPEGKLEQRA